MSLKTQLDELDEILSELVRKIQSDNSRNDTFINFLCEGIFSLTFSKIFKKDFINTNIDNPNSPAVDLCSKDKKIYIQVTSSGTTAKLYRTLRTFLKKEDYKNSSELYLFILGSTKDTFSQAQETVNKILKESDNKKNDLEFDINKNIFEIKDVVNKVQNNFENINNSIRVLDPIEIEQIISDLKKSIRKVEYKKKSIELSEKPSYLQNINDIENNTFINRILIEF